MKYQKQYRIERFEKLCIYGVYILIYNQYLVKICIFSC